MSGLSSFKLGNVIWADSHLDKIEIEYDHIALDICESTGREVRVVFYGHIGYKVIGFWDESILEECFIHENHPFLDECIQEIKRNNGEVPLDTGDIFRNKRKWCVAEICMIDRVTILIVANSAEVVVDYKKGAIR